MEITEILEHKKVSGDILYLVRAISINAIGNNISKIWMRKHRIELFGDRSLIKRYNDKLELEAELKENEEVQRLEIESAHCRTKKNKGSKDRLHKKSDNITELNEAQQTVRTNRFNLRPKKKNLLVNAMIHHKSKITKVSKLKQSSIMLAVKLARPCISGPVPESSPKLEIINFNSSIINNAVKLQDCNGYELYRSHLNELSKRLLKK